jgi:hypothetical protein
VEECDSFGGAGQPEPFRLFLMVQGSDYPGLPYRTVKAPAVILPFVGAGFRPSRRWLKPPERWLRFVSRSHVRFRNGWWQEVLPASPVMEEDQSMTQNIRPISDRFAPTPGEFAILFGIAWVIACFCFPIFAHPHSNTNMAKVHETPFRVH